MRSSTFRYAVVILAILAVCSALPSLADTSDEKPVRSVTNVKIKQRPAGEPKRVIPFDENADQISVVTADKKRRVISVELGVTVYEGKLVQKTDSESTEKCASWFCYELESKDKDVPYSWHMWADTTVGIFGHFKCFITSEKHNYLTWVGDRYLYITEVSKAMVKANKIKGLDDHVNGRGGPALQTVDVCGVTGQNPYKVFLDGNSSPHFFSIYVTSLEDDGEGGLRLQLHGKDPSNVYTIVTDKKSEYGWRLVK